MSFSVPGLAGTTWTWDTRGEYSGTVLGSPLVSQVLQGLLAPGTLEVNIQVLSWNVLYCPRSSRDY